MRTADDGLDFEGGPDLEFGSKAGIFVAAILTSHTPGGGAITCLCGGLTSQSASYSIAVFRISVSVTCFFDRFILADLDEVIFEDFR